MVGIILGALLVGSLVFKEKDNPQLESEQQEVQTSLAPQTNSEGAVEVEVTPNEISANSDSWQFKIVLNTHSVELDQDLTKLAFLKDSGGNEYLPLSWDGAPPGGHHREGVLTFRPVSPQPAFIELVIKDIDGIKERKFTWDLKQ
ncbi:hypothetical protein A3A76_01960 [Candidatus Woesebacteria bacterium RIFCSPLOWO2_01_FULL_39_23]|uniref:DUF4352 domain-containing protein n=1 Tax=Candidatus Woesebacteria bacterium RIFCSPHIGHO2_01_FULL_40_22 TaxID=1802499 RepID=A0A1F7YIG0_9BACT|nr:MAG: hypothetical protein A2141_05190 [Candidatus Woesebacteria bacterium RBG_16_40_11]OGM26368.1 MAG: hypothetical protein A2628_03305 [Candidatus Woesebacteria bacterium RIFCSPHIGHO2_01_FULL_40_22]OGM37684.1 MAG: hypothetical protein A3E41_05280 [Candidatus Woesebacteria bacterium RIFCSPHIGHO2_12_FULL_38_9]OGM61911.1 MAG: hypothetical protein A3A76_01960 [Candidatus Woesebacteria bacterium RIFCSPLOWO2_01_FULL_39_23]